MDDPIKKFEDEVDANLRALAEDDNLHGASRVWLREASRYNYSYNFRWLGRPIIQFPQDIVAVQELIFTVQPTLIIETGIAHGGSLILSASMLELNAACGGPQEARVLGVDIDIRAHNRAAIESHPMFKRIDMLEGSSTSEPIVSEICARAEDAERVLVFLDSNHTHAHVLAELRAYAPLVSQGSYCVVFDTIVEDFPKGWFDNRPWDVGDNPKTAVQAYLAELDEQPQIGQDGAPLHYEIDQRRDAQLLISVAPSGYLRRLELPTGTE